MSLTSTLTARQQICVSRASRLGAVLAGAQGITADLALRLGRYFGTTPAFWMSLQNKYDLEQASDAMSDEMDRIARVA